MIEIHTATPLPPGTTATVEAWFENKDGNVHDRVTETCPVIALVFFSEDNGRTADDARHQSYEGIDPVLIHSGDVLRESDVRRRLTSAGSRFPGSGFKFDITYSGPPVGE